MKDDRSVMLSTSRILYPVGPLRSGIRGVLLSYDPVTPFTTRCKRWCKRWCKPQAGKLGWLEVLAQALPEFEKVGGCDTRFFDVQIEVTTRERSGRRSQAALEAGRVQAQKECIDPRLASTGAGLSGRRQAEPHGSATKLGKANKENG